MIRDILHEYRWLLQVVLYVVRLVAFSLICAVIVWAVAMLVSLGLGTTEFGTTPTMKARIGTWAFWMMWCAILFPLASLVADGFFWLVTKMKL